ncbi:NAD-binding protein [Lipomyces kononenkoae]|uniref:NAD-binding protein n=1 Tax=Lipomyces kononenkoae TaxID=34357 RepID=A0ACC3SR67_LIPKO
MGKLFSSLEKMFSLEGKTALVTGGTRAIGRAIAIGLAEAGSDIILIQRDLTRRETLDAIEAVGSKATISEEVKGLTDHITKTLGRTIDILVNCGGIQLLQVNLTTCFTLARDIGRHMLENIEKNPQGYRGKIINFASLASFQGGVTVPAYAAAKHGILGMTKPLSNYWVGKGINVNAIAPGYVATEMNTALIANPMRSRQTMERIPMGRWGTPDDFKGVVVFLASAASDYMSGDCVTVDGGWMARQLCGNYRASGYVFCMCLADIYKP